MDSIVIVLLAAGAIAFNGTLGRVHETRNELYNENLPIDGFVCRAGVQYRYRELLGQKIYGYDIENDKLLGPFLVVDMASVDHEGEMEGSHIAMDTDCKDITHEMAIFFTLNEEVSVYPDAISVRHSTDITAAVRTRLRNPHRLCGRGVQCHWRVENWIWEE